MTARRPRLAFVSPSFLFPNDAGGKIRTTNVLRGLKGGAFETTLISPASAAQKADWAAELRGACDHFIGWEPVPVRPRWQRAFSLLGELPVNVAADRSAVARQAVQQALAATPFDVVVFDFVHAAVLRPPSTAGAATVCFTHNVEAEIFARHSTQASNPLMQKVWASQHVKMLRFEREALRSFDSVIAVSQRDAAFFAREYGIVSPQTIPTGVDLDFFSWQTPPPIDAANPPTAVFTGTMDWAANIDGIDFFLSDVWPLVQAEMPEARFNIVGRSPSAALVERTRNMRGVTCTGFVDDVRPYVHGAHAFVIPLRVGGGTRIKAFEAMAMGCPVVSTAIGMEGLDVEPGQHFLLRDSASEQARAVLDLMRDPDLRATLSQDARKCVEDRFGHRVAAQTFEKICLHTLDAARTKAS